MKMIGAEQQAAHLPDGDNEHIQIVFFDGAESLSVSRHSHSS